VFLTLALCLSAPVPKARPELYFPTAVGAEWVYSWAIEPPQQGAELSPVNAVTKADGNLVTMSHTVKGRSFASRRFEATGAGLSVVAVDNRDGKFKAVGPDVLLRLPARVGERWECVNEDGRKCVRTTRGVEEAKTPAGTFPAVRVDTELAIPDAAGVVAVVSVSSWYAPGVGLVRETRRRGPAGSASVLQLKSFTPARR
jgi:hypothetical protein